MNQEIKKKWVEALKSGKYKQGHTFLRRGDNTYCCLGVLCELYSEEDNKTNFIKSQDDLYYKINNSSALPPPIIVKWAELKDSNPVINIDGRVTTLAYLNDDIRLSFKEIANIIEEQL